MMKILIENWKLLLLWKEMWREGRFMCVKLVEKNMQLVIFKMFERV